MSEEENIGSDRAGAGAEGGGGRVFGGMEVLQCYNPHRSERFCTIGVLQRCYSGATGCYVCGRKERKTAETQQPSCNQKTLTAENAKMTPRAVLFFRRLPIFVQVASSNQTALLNLAQSSVLSNNFWQDVADENPRKQRKPDIGSPVFNHR